MPADYFLKNIFILFYIKCDKAQSHQHKQIISTVISI